MKFQVPARIAAPGRGGWLLLWTLLVGLAFSGCTPAGPASLLEGRKLLEKGQPRAALQPLHDAVQIMRTNGLAWSYLGLAYQQTDQASNAVTCYLQALRWDRDLVDVRYNLGQAYLDLGRPDAARLELITFTVQRPKALHGWLARGLADLRTKEPASALASYSTALRLSPTNAEALNGLGLALVQRGRAREAAPYFTAAIQQQPRFAVALRNLATVQQQQLKDPVGALQTWKQYAALTPPPADLAAVQTLIRQLEAALAPPPVAPAPAPAPAPTTPPVTNAVRVPKPAVTNPPPALPSNPPPARVAVPSNPPPVVAPPVVPVTPPRTSAPPVVVTPPAPPPPRTNPPPVVVASNPPPPLEVVQVPDETVLPPARDPVPPPKPAASNPPPAVVTAPPPTATPPVTPETTNAEPKRGFFAKVNPLNLFKKKPKEEPSAPRPTTPPPVADRPITLPPRTNATTTAITPPVTTPTNTPAVAAPTPRPPAARVTPTPTFPRYAYTRPLRPAAGNRADATRAFRAGSEAQTAGRTQQAFDEYQRATLADPQFFEAWNNLGLAAHELGLTDASLTAFETALAVRPDSAEARYNFAVALRDAGYPLDAVSELQPLLTANPADVRVHLALGNLYAQKLRDLPQARSHYRRVLDLDPANAQAATIRTWLRNNPG